MIARGQGRAAVGFSINVVPSSRGHSAHVGRDVEIHYRWHPYFGRQLRCEYSEDRASGRIVHLVVAPGHVITAPAWMIDPVVCAAMEQGSPRVSLASLLELHRLLIERRLRRGSLDGSTIAEAQHEELATTNPISRDRSPTQHAARLSKADRADPDATNDRNRRLANLLMAAAGVATEESRDDEQ